MMKIVDKQIEQYQAELEIIMEKLRRLLPTTIILEKKKGKVQLSVKNLELIDIYNIEFRNILREAGYFEFIDKFINDEAVLIKELAEESKTDFVPIVLGASALAIFSAIQKTEIAGFDTIITDAANSIKTTVKDGIFAGEPYLDVIDSALAKLDNKMGNYTNTYVTTTRTIFEQKAIDIAAKEAGDDLNWEYIGPDDSKTRPQCKRGLKKKVFSLEEKEAFQAEGLRWNCRHIFKPISEEDFTKVILDQMIERDK